MYITAIIFHLFIVSSAVQIYECSKRHKISGNIQSFNTNKVHIQDQKGRLLDFTGADNINPVDLNWRGKESNEENGCTDSDSMLCGT